MRVTQLWRYPVKSLQGERVDAAVVGSHGLEWDRHWALVDDATGFALTARREPRLLEAAAAVVDGVAVVSLPSGVATSADGELSDWLGRPVRLAAARPDTRGTYETPLDFEHEQTTPWVQWHGPKGSFHDSTRTMVSVVSEATVGHWDVRRFRQNVVVDGAGEDEFVGRRIRIGEGDDPVELDVVKPIDRCVVVTRPQPGLPRDVEVLRTINRTRAGFLGVGCLVARGGSIQVGDSVAVAG